MKNKIVVIVFGKLKSNYKRRIKNKEWRRFLIFSSIIHAIIRIFLSEFSSKTIWNEFQYRW